MMEQQCLAAGALQQAMQEAESQAVLSSSDEVPDGGGSQQGPSQGRHTRVKAAQSKQRQASSSKVTGMQLCGKQTDPPKPLTGSGRQHSLCQLCSRRCTMEFEFPWPQVRLPLSNLEVLDRN